MRIAVLLRAAFSFLLCSYGSVLPALGMNRVDPIWHLTYNLYVRVKAVLTEGSPEWERVAVR